MVTQLRESFIKHMECTCCTTDEEMYSEILAELEAAGMRPPADPWFDGKWEPEVSRQDANKEIAHRLLAMAEKHPHLRFGQLLLLSSIIKAEEGKWKNEFFVESLEILNRMNVE
jgi:hypothetical protein